MSAAFYAGWREPLWGDEVWIVDWAGGRAWVILLRALDRSIVFA